MATYSANVTIKVKNGAGVSQNRTVNGNTALFSTGAKEYARFQLRIQSVVSAAGTANGSIQFNGVSIKTVSQSGAGTNTSPYFDFHVPPNTSVVFSTTFTGIDNSSNVVGAYTVFENTP